jgi:hypothetical protein
MQVEVALVASFNETCSLLDQSPFGLVPVFRSRSLAAVIPPDAAVS